MRTFVWVDSWQQQCCGEPFELGSRVTWKVVPQTGRDEWVAQLLGDDWGDAVQFHEEHHNDPADAITGTVAGINVVTSHRVLGQHGGGQAWVPLPGGGRLSPTDVADPWEPEKDLDRSGEMTFDGWIVELDGAYVTSV